MAGRSSLLLKVARNEASLQLVQPVSIPPGSGNYNLSVPITRGSGTYNLSRPAGREGSYHWSQARQDKVVDLILGGRRQGFFVEIGGYDGELHANTLFFEIVKGWDGLLVEANPFTFKQMLRKDRNCNMVNACISKVVPSMKFEIAGGLTSAVDLMSPKHKSRMVKDVSTYSKTATWEGAGNVVETKCVHLNDLLSVIGVKHVDYFSLDVEGAEMFVLESIDFDTVTFDVLTIEIQEHRSEIQAFMESKGYKKVTGTEYKLDFDDIFVPTEKA